MSAANADDVGTVVSIWRYPVKSMTGESLDEGRVSSRGLVGDRLYALRDRADGRIATAKNPRKWPTLFACGATLIESEAAGGLRVRITLPGGRELLATDPQADAILSDTLQRNVTLVSTSSAGETGGAPVSVSEEYWPDIDGLDHRDAVTDFELPAGTFFDCATVHLLTTATLDRLRASYPNGRFDVRRFRPNVVVKPESGPIDFVENLWLDRDIAIGHQVRLRINAPCGRCVMTTLPQRDLPPDQGILRTVVKENRGNVGVYAAVIVGGTIRFGDRVRLMGD